jgi:hypothetical protein
MALERLISRIREIKQTLIDNREREVILIALDQLALTKLRIQREGKDFNESAFAPYTDAYKKERGAAGYQIGYVDFTRTGRLWANIQPRISQSDVFSATVVIEGSEQRSKDIVRGAAKKRGNILQPSKAEIEFTRQANRRRVLRAFGLNS